MIYTHVLCFVITMSYLSGNMESPEFDLSQQHAAHFVYLHTACCSQPLCAHKAALTACRTSNYCYTYKRLIHSFRPPCHCMQHIDINLVCFFYFLDQGPRRLISAISCLTNATSCLMIATSCLMIATSAFTAGIISIHCALLCCFCQNASSLCLQR